ncbi:hypothetical protein [Arenimonas terrae]|uniref:Uncharacterized protein n=1 Tax=Arenimonas terrae TaxID=2546226 RepID=A0A5C4RW87_9GAMM|nr:hypothetical protein [Arenimonas terrae]TNJ35526.1 hypothetical protein E1B00_07190 [Arenimonas terrae]
MPLVSAVFGMLPFAVFPVAILFAPPGWVLFGLLPIAYFVAAAAATFYTQAWVSLAASSPPAVATTPRQDSFQAPLPMTLPLFVIDDGDVLMFRSATALEQYVESPDIPGYRVFDAEGRRLSLEAEGPAPKPSRWLASLSPVHLVVPETASDGSAELAGFLRSCLARASPDEAPAPSDLAGLVSLFCARGWYTE